MPVGVLPNWDFNFSLPKLRTSKGSKVSNLWSFLLPHFYSIKFSGSPAQQFGIVFYFWVNDMNETKRVNFSSVRSCHHSGSRSIKREDNIIYRQYHTWHLYIASRSESIFSSFLLLHASNCSSYNLEALQLPWTLKISTEDEK